MCACCNTPHIIATHHHMQTISLQSSVWFIALYTQIRRWMIVYELNNSKTVRSELLICSKALGLYTYNLQHLAFAGQNSGALRFRHVGQIYRVIQEGERVKKNELSFVDSACELHEIPGGRGRVYVHTPCVFARITQHVESFVKRSASQRSARQTLIRTLCNTTIAPGMCITTRHTDTHTHTSTPNRHTLKQQIISRKAAIFRGAQGCRRVEWSFLMYV